MHHSFPPNIPKTGDVVTIRGIMDAKNGHEVSLLHELQISSRTLFPTNANPKDITLEEYVFLHDSVIFCMSDLISIASLSQGDNIILLVYYSPDQKFYLFNSEDGWEYRTEVEVSF